MVDFSFLINFLSAISSIAIILGAVFVVFQLRQNARLIKTASFETKSNMSFSVLEKITEESFARRRKNMHDSVKKFSQVNWEGFDDSLEDYEARNFGYIYELIGELVKEEIIDLTIAIHSLRYSLSTHTRTSSGLPRRLGRSWKSLERSATFPGGSLRRDLSTSLKICEMSKQSSIGLDRQASF